MRSQRQEPHCERHSTYGGAKFIAKRMRFCAYTAANGDFLITMNADKTITVTFDKDNVHSVLIDLPTMKYYPSISDAYLDASVPTVIKAWGTDITDSLILNKDLAVTIRGGYNSEYTSNPGTTTIHGTVTVKKGSLTVEHLIVQ